jgi:hypothetical protein
MATKKKKSVKPKMAAPAISPAASVGAAPAANTGAADPWPNSVAAKVLASYIHLKFDVSASHLMLFNPPMGAMPFFNNSSSKEIRHAELSLVAGSLLKFLTEISIPLEDGATLDDALATLVVAMEVETAPSSDMVTVIDVHFRFVDEAHA